MALKKHYNYAPWTTWGNMHRDYKRALEHKNDFEQMIHGFSRMLEVYEEIKKWCDKLGIKLINCSGHTILESIPRERLEKILNIE